MHAAERRTGSAAGNRPPAWDLAYLFPRQGDWTEEDFLALERDSDNRLIELVDGCIEVLPMPDPYHQRLAKYTFRKLDDHVSDLGAGETFFAPLPVRLGANHLREPDIVFVKTRRIKNPRKPPRGADLVMEIVSPGQKNRRRDLETKRVAYAKARIGEYWIIDPEKERVVVLTLHGQRYKVYGQWGPGDVAKSRLLPGFEIVVAELFAAGEGK